jgi:SAM-dependent methyltransferase
MDSKNTPPVCNYEGSDYQTSFWEQGGREYEDRAEALALKRLLPSRGRLMLELGAGAGRNTPRYAGFDRIVLLDYSRTQLEQAQQRLGISERYYYVAADVYRLPFVDGLFDGATMIRVLHHMADAPRALEQVKKVMRPGGTFILEFANKLNLKAILESVHARAGGVRKIEFRLSPHGHPTMVDGIGFQYRADLDPLALSPGAVKTPPPHGTAGDPRWAFTAHRGLVPINALGVRQGQTRQAQPAR